MAVRPQLDLRALSQAYKALGDETRLQMLALLLAGGELCVCRFEAALSIGQSKASRHLRYLLNAGLLQDRREGVWVHYRIAAELSPELSAVVASVEEAFGAEELALLRAELEASAPADGEERVAGATGSMAAAEGCDLSCGS